MNGLTGNWSLAAVGDVTRRDCWSGIPSYFREAAERAGWQMRPWKLDLARFGQARWRWNLAQIILGAGRGGFQYSAAFLDRAEEMIPADFKATQVISFNQHFPRAQTLTSAGGTSWRYLDATVASLCEGEDATVKLPARIREEALRFERENLQQSHRVVTMARWAAESVIQDCGVSAERVSTILPGANLNLPHDWSFSYDERAPGKERPLVLGFVGKDWQRKGLPFLLRVRGVLARMNWQVVVRAVGHCPDELKQTDGLEYAGFIDKERDAARLVDFIAGCDLGCLFSRREPLGISTLEFLRVGVPVAGFNVEGLRDTLPPTAGLSFELDASAEQVAEKIAATFGNENSRFALRRAARAISPVVTWDRCIREWRELVEQGHVTKPVRLWDSVTAEGGVS